MGQAATANQPEQTTTFPRFGLGKLGWAAWAFMFLGTAPFVLAEGVDAIGALAVVMTAIVAYAWLRFLKFVAKALGAL